MRQRIYDLVGQAADGDYASRAYDLFIVFIAIISLVPMLFDSSKISEFEESILWNLDVVTAFILLFDYVLRWMTADIKTGKGWRAFLRYPFTPMAIIDLLAILPTLNVVPQSLRWLRLLRVVKVFRYSRNLIVITNACYREAKTLGSVFLVVVVYMLTVALIVFNCEPECFNNYFEAVCWSCTTMTSVSFTDGRPVGEIGRAISVLSSLVALLVVALPAGIITGAYLSEMRNSQRQGSGYFHMAGRTKLRLNQLDRPSVWLDKNRKILRYFITMLLCVLLDVAIYFIVTFCGFTVYPDYVGIALAAFLLEPAAGIFVAFALAVLNTINADNVSMILTLIPYSGVAIAFGIVFPRKESKHKVLRSLATVAIVILVATFGELLVYLVAGGFVPEQALAAAAQNSPYMAPYLDLSGRQALHVLGLFLMSRSVAETGALLALFLVIVKLFGVHAAPSEKERAQQEVLSIQRVLEERAIEDEALREVHQWVLKRKIKELKKQQAQLEEERKTLQSRLAEMRDQADSQVAKPEEVN